MKERISEILGELKAKGYQIDELIFDGEFHHFKLSQEDPKKRGSYIGERTALGFQLKITNFKDRDLDQSFFIKGEDRSAEEIKEDKKQIEDAKAKRDRKRLMQQQTVSNEALRTFNASPGAPLTHPYFIRKKLKSSYDCRERLGSLLVPARDVEGVFWGYQIIPKEGHKANLKGMRILGCFHLIGEIDPEKEVYIAEGFATAATLYETDGIPSICAFSAGNLRAVGEALRIKYPKLKMIFAGDNDLAGKKAAKAAAFATRSLYIIPEMKSPHPEMTDFNDLREYEGEGTVRMQLQSEERKLKPKNDKEAFIEEWFEKFEVDVSYSGAYTSFGARTELLDLKSQIILDSGNANRPIPERLLEAKIRIWSSLKKREKFEIVKADILQFIPNSELETLLPAFIKNPSQIDFLMFQQFMWLVKRKLAGFKVENHVMPVISGKHRSGKSETIRKLLAPLQELADESDFSVLEDERKYYELTQRYVLYFDEMERAERTDIAAIKRQITAPRVSYRLLFTNHTETGPMNCTFIATTNDRLQNLIKDKSTMRRFYEMISLDRADFEVINKINFLKIWQGVNHLAPCPMNEVLDEVDAHQEKSRHRTDVELFCENLGVKPSDEPKTLKDIKKLYDQYIIDFGGYPATVNYLSSELDRLGFKKIRKGPGMAFLLKEAKYIETT